MRPTPFSRRWRRNRHPSELAARPPRDILERFQAKWIPVRVKKTRQIKNLEPRFDSIETEKALGAIFRVFVHATRRRGQRRHHPRDRARYLGIARARLRPPGRAGVAARLSPHRHRADLRERT